MQINKAQDTYPAHKDVLLVIDSLKKQVAAERCISIKVQNLIYDSGLSLIFFIWTIWLFLKPDNKIFSCI